MTGLGAVLERIEAAATSAGRKAADIELVAVSKYATDEQVEAVYDQGQRHFGENRADDLVRRSQVMPGDIVWHFVGSLQRNKVRRVRPVAGSLHSLDRVALAEAWLEGPGAPPPVFIQVDLAGEPQKGGVGEEGCLGLVEHALGIGLDVRGLMTIPPAGDDPTPWFERLRNLSESLAVAHPEVSGLSMGMTDDFETAIARGATVLRVGRAIFASTEES